MDEVDGARALVTVDALPLDAMADLALDAGALEDLDRAFWVAPLVTSDFATETPVGFAFVLAVPELLIPPASLVSPELLIPPDLVIRPES